MTFIDPRMLWLWPNADHGSCCDCCDCCAGYCPMTEGDFDPEWTELYHITVNGVEYIGSPYVMIRTDMLDPEQMPEHILDTKVQSDWPTPTAKPREVDIYQRADLVYVLDKAGLTLHELDDEVKVALYLGDEFVGWTTRSGPSAEHSIRRADLPAVRRVADAAGLPLLVAGVAWKAALSGEAS